MKFSIQDLASTITTSYSQTIDSKWPGSFISGRGGRCPSWFFEVLSWGNPTGSGPLGARPGAGCQTAARCLRSVPQPLTPSPWSPTELGQFTNLRINFTALPHIARQGYRSPSTFYAVMEMQVLGSCFCHGHADRCAPSGNLHTAVSTGVK